MGKETEGRGERVRNTPTTIHGNFILTSSLARLWRSNDRHLNRNNRLRRRLFQETGRALHERVPLVPSRAEVHMLSVYNREGINTGAVLRWKNFTFQELKSNTKQLSVILWFEQHYFCG